MMRKPENEVPTEYGGGIGGCVWETVWGKDPGDFSESADLS